MQGVKEIIQQSKNAKNPQPVDWTSLAVQVAEQVVKQKWDEIQEEIKDTAIATVKKLAEQYKPELKGDQGEQGKPGKDGKNGRDGKDGADGERGLPGKDGKDGADGINGEDGKDGSPDTAEDIANKLNTLNEEVEIRVIKGLETRLRNMGNAIREASRKKMPRGGGDSIIAGDNITVERTASGRRRVSSTGGSGSGGGTLEKQKVDGVINGANLVFTIPTAFVGKSIIILDSQTFVQDLDYTVSGTTITYLTAPASDHVEANHYLVCGGSLEAAAWSFGQFPTEAPSGTLDGTGSITVFTLPITPIQVVVYADGVRAVPTVDYSISGDTITFVSLRQPFSSISVDYLS